jgi:hypothetical protein
VRMLQVRRRGDLVQEPFGADDRGELRPQDLERDLSFVPDVERQVHGRHAARAELTLDAITVGEGFGEEGEGLSHPRRQGMGGAITCRAPRSGSNRAGDVYSSRMSSPSEFAMANAWL